MLLRDLKSTISDDSVVFIQEGSGHPRFYPSWGTCKLELDDNLWGKEAELNLTNGIFIRLI